MTVLDRLRAGEQVASKEVFNYVVEAVLGQGRPSRGVAGDCLYRDGITKCAAGHLIPDDLYTITMESMDIMGVLEGHKKLSFLHPYRDLLLALQGAHDLAAITSDVNVGDKDYEPFVKGFKRRAQEVSDRNKLGVTIA
jgi:hypothetical protein